VELRRPYRDLRLVDFALGVPAHLLYRPGESKRVLRQAMRGLLPEAVRQRSVPSPLSPLFWRGLAERESSTVHTLLGRRDAVWPRYVPRAWMARALEPGGIRRLGDGIEAVVLWRCLCVELWCEARRAASAHALRLFTVGAPAMIAGAEGTAH
jgi:asparagine synthase (glutamine-hydrolysing)